MKLYKKIIIGFDVAFAGLVLLINAVRYYTGYYFFADAFNYTLLNKINLFIAALALVVSAFAFVNLTSLDRILRRVLCFVFAAAVFFVANTFIMLFDMWQNSYVTAGERNEIVFMTGSEMKTTVLYRKNKNFALLVDVILYDDIFFYIDKEKCEIEYTDDQVVFRYIYDGEEGEYIIPLKKYNYQYD